MYYLKNWIKVFYLSKILSQKTTVRSCCWEAIRSSLDKITQTMVPTWRSTSAQEASSAPLNPWTRSSERRWLWLPKAGHKPSLRIIRKRLPSATHRRCPPARSWPSWHLNISPHTTCWCPFCTQPCKGSSKHSTMWTNEKTRQKPRAKTKVWHGWVL